MIEVKDCTEGTSDSAAATTDTTTALSTTFASASTIAPIFVDDYEVIGADDQAVADGDTTFFPNRVPLSTTKQCDLHLTALAFFTSADRVTSVSSSTNTCLLKCAKLVDDILLSAPAFLVSLLGTCLIESALKLMGYLRKVFENRSHPGINEVHPFWFVSISPALEPFVKDDPSVNKIHGSGSSSSTSIRVSKESSSVRLTMKSANICPLTDTLAGP
nr:hypothetical protein [Tanacetum cinerariifolium]